MQNEDFVWHLVLGTLLSLFFGMRPAGQVCRSTAHTQPLTVPSAPASSLCRWPASHPVLPQPGYTRAGGVSKEVLLALFLCGDEKGWLSAC